MALASTAGLLVLAGCTSAPYSTTPAPAYQSYVAPTEAPNALYGENYGESYETPYYGPGYETPYYGQSYEGPYDVAPNAQDCSIVNKHPSGASC